MSDQALHGEAGSTAESVVGSPTAATPPWPNQVYSWYVVGVLLLAYTLSFIDRMILSLLVAPVRESLGITDTQFSLLVGMAFALFYTIAGLPLAWVADRFSRRNLIVGGIGLWSFMTLSCGVATSYIGLFIGRMGVGVGEATLSPAAFSMLSDYFPKKRLARAIAVYSIGVPLGSGIALMLGALVIKAILAAPEITLPYIGQVEAWRLTFAFVAFPGILICLLMLTVREPFRRGRMTVEQHAISGSQSFVAHVMTHKLSLGCMFAGMSLISMVMYGALAWTPAFLSRTYPINITDAGLLFGAIMAICGAGGLILGGVVADWMFGRGHTDGHIRTIRLSLLLGGPFLILTPLMPSATWALALLAPGFLFITMHGVGTVALQVITPNEYRARITALYFFVANLIGLGLGPTVIALVTDFGFGNDAALRYSLFTVSGIALPVAGLILTLGMPAYRRSVANIAEVTDSTDYAAGA
ncbi:MFS transporter [Hyphomonas sp.]|uniref:spinster family MFS transporter n=1 Tax=Hyphomonas sp. TaxID=87 RepID=UPI0032D8D0C4